MYKNVIEFLFSNGVYLKDGKRARELNLLHFYTLWYTYVCM